jgi:replicative DNA helicase Mcm
MVMIDELDKMSVEDRSAMHEALEQQTVSISKANIQATLRAETTVLAAANPKFGRFDQYEIIANQINLPPTLINRFDLIFTIKDLPDSQRDEKMARHILTLHQNPDIQEGEINTDLLKKYLAYVKQTCFPVLTEGAIDEIKKYYVDMRNKGNEGETGIKSVPISPRQLEALVRISEGISKLRLSDKVARKDAKRAVDLMHYCLSQIGIDPETGKIDIDRIATGITASQRSHIMGVKEIIADLESRVGKTIPIEDIIREAGEKGIDSEVVEESIEKLKRSGDLFEPKRGFVARI